MTAYIFAITTLETGHPVAEAIICPQSRYASIAWRGSKRLERRVVPFGQWTHIQRELADGWPLGLVERGSATAHALVGGRVAVFVQLINQTPVKVERPADLPRVLDAQLQPRPS